MGRPIHMYSHAVRSFYLHVTRMRTERAGLQWISAGSREGEGRGIRREGGEKWRVAEESFRGRCTLMSYERQLTKRVNKNLL